MSDLLVIRLVSAWCNNNCSTDVKGQIAMERERWADGGIFNVLCFWC